ncbi:MAG TPA: transketolase C-terminal domain-containing protein, partial [Acidimicrobiales bacterium]|nr:transketolase C-terminal domain-containing protein [Acidimicrobiales bacterium]
TGTTLKGLGVQSYECPEGRQIYFGVREHAMGAICNGLALHGGFIPVNGTFFVFADYMRGAVRLAALSNAKNIFVWSHDSVGVGEDGPTHQPVEHLSSLRSMPNLQLFRPADANETAAAWTIAIDTPGPTGLILTRQDVPVLKGTDDIEKISKGAYILSEPEHAPEVVIIGTGSEVSVAIEASEILDNQGINVRVVSMPSMGLFAQQDENYQSSVLPKETPTISIEAGSTFGWHQWSDTQIGIDRFGASAPGETVMENLGISATSLVAAVQDLLQR